MFLIPRRKFSLTASAVVWNGQASAAVATVRDDCRAANGRLRARTAPSRCGCQAGADRLRRRAGCWRSWVGARVPSTMRTEPLRNRWRGRSVSSGPRWSMMRPAADFEIPKGGPSWRSVKFVCQYAATSKTRSSNGGLRGRPRRTASAPSRRTSLQKQRGLNPVDGPIQDGCDAVTPATRRSSHSEGPTRRL